MSLSIRRTNRDIMYTIFDYWPEDLKDDASSLTTLPGSTAYAHQQETGCVEVNSKLFSFVIPSYVWAVSIVSAMVSTETTRTPPNPRWEINAIFMPFAVHTSCPSFMYALIWNLHDAANQSTAPLPLCGSLKSMRATRILQRVPICRHARIMREEW